MKRLPLLLDEPPKPLVRAATLLCIPVALVLLMPVVLLFILALYVLAILQGARVLVTVVTGSRATFEPEYNKPHFLELPAPLTPVSDANHNTTTVGDDNQNACKDS